MENVSTAETTVGIDLGDRQSRVCILSAEGDVREEGWIATTEAALVPRFRAMARARIVMEVGTHSPWVSRLLQAAGHEVIVANPRQLRLITHSSTKTDRNDAEMLARLGRADPGLLKPVAHRSKEGPSRPRHPPLPPGAGGCPHPAHQPGTRDGEDGRRSSARL
jgi:transposase